MRLVQRGVKHLMHDQRLTSIAGRRLPRQEQCILQMIILGVIETGIYRDPDAAVDDRVRHALISAQRDRASRVSESQRSTR